MKSAFLRLPALLGALLGTLALPLQAQTGEGRMYTPGAFERLELSGAANVRLTQGERDQVFIAGDAKTQESVEVDLHGDRLTIRPSGGWKFWSPARLQIDIQMRQLRQLVLSGAGDLHAAGPIRAEQLTLSISGAGQARFDDLQAERLRFVISGAGDGLLKGRVQDLQLQVSGKGKLLADELRAQRANVSISGVGSASLWVQEDLRVGISGVGTVEYWGQPEVRRSSSGMASVRSLGGKR
ncbi:MAG TPA: head GIN domain-containing protein [Roseateles sp.]|nr:head GIN domain-containing protein [Roseateles sp.]